MRSTLLVLIALFTTSCTTTTGYSRGAFVRRTPLDTERTPSAPVLQTEGGVAFLIVPAKVCTSYRDEVAKLRDRRTKHPSYVRLVVGLGLAALGVPLLIHGATALADSSDSNADLLATIVGAPLSLVGTVMAASSPMDGDIDYDHLPTGETFADMTTECEDETVRLREATQWTMRWGSTERSGVTQDDGLLSLPAIAYRLLETAPASLVAPQLLRDGKVELGFQLGGNPGTFEVPINDIPNAAWVAWNTGVAKDRDSARRMRLAACRAIRSSEDDVQRCVWQQEPMLGEFSGTLTATETGDYTTTLQFAGTAGTRFSLFFALPHDGLDWYAQVVELDRGEIVAEGLSGSDDRLDLTGTIPQTGTYLVTLQADRAGAFKANLLVTK